MLDAAFTNGETINNEMHFKTVPSCQNSVLLSPILEEASPVKSCGTNYHISNKSFIRKRIGVVIVINLGPKSDWIWA